VPLSTTPASFSKLPHAFLRLFSDKLSLLSFINDQCSSAQALRVSISFVFQVPSRLMPGPGPLASAFVRAFQLFSRGTLSIRALATLPLVLHLRCLLVPGRYLYAAVNYRQPFPIQCFHIPRRLNSPCCKMMTPASGT
jgi:hypothetical protein